MHRAVNNEQRLVPHHGILSLSFDQKPKTQPKPTNPRPETRTPEQIRSCLGCRTNKSSSSVLLLLLQQQQHQLQIETYSTATDQVNQVSGAVSRSYSIRHRCPMPDAPYIGGVCVSLGLGVVRYGIELYGMVWHVMVFTGGLFFSCLLLCVISLRSSRS